MSRYHDRVHRQGLVADRADRRRIDAVGATIAIAYAEWPREWMHPARIIEHRVLVGVVGRAGANERRDE